MSPIQYYLTSITMRCCVLYLLLFYVYGVASEIFIVDVVDKTIFVDGDWIPIFNAPTTDIPLRNDNVTIQKNIYLQVSVEVHEETCRMDFHFPGFSVLTKQNIFFVLSDYDREVIIKNFPSPHIIAGEEIQQGTIFERFAFPDIDFSVSISLSNSVAPTLAIRETKSDPACCRISGAIYDVPDTCICSGDLIWEVTAAIIFGDSIIEGRNIYITGGTLVLGERIISFQAVEEIAITANSITSDESCAWSAFADVFTGTFSSSFSFLGSLMLRVSHINIIASGRIDLPEDNNNISCTSCSIKSGGQITVNGFFTSDTFYIQSNGEVKLECSVTAAISIDIHGNGVSNTMASTFSSGESIRITGSAKGVLLSQSTLIADSLYINGTHTTQGSGVTLNSPIIQTNTTEVIGNSLNSHGIEIRRGTGASGSSSFCGVTSASSGKAGINVLVAVDHQFHGASLNGSCTGSSTCHGIRFGKVVFSGETNIIGTSNNQLNSAGIMFSGPSIRFLSDTEGTISGSGKIGVFIESDCDFEAESAVSITGSSTATEGIGIFADIEVSGEGNLNLIGSGWVGVRLDISGDIDMLSIDGEGEGSAGIRIIQLNVHFATLTINGHSSTSHGIDIQSNVLPFYGSCISTWSGSTNGDSVKYPIYARDSLSVNLRSCQFTVNSFLNVKGALNISGDSDSVVSMIAGGKTTVTMAVDTNGAKIFPSGFTAGGNMFWKKFGTLSLCGEFSALQIAVWVDSIVECPLGKMSLGFYATSGAIELSAIDAASDLGTVTNVTIRAVSSVTLHSSIGDRAAISSLFVKSNDLNITETCTVIHTIGDQEFNGQTMQIGAELLIRSDAGTAIFNTSATTSNDTRCIIESHSEFVMDTNCYFWELDLKEGAHRIDGTVLGNIMLLDQSIVNGIGALGHVHIVESGSVIEPDVTAPGGNSLSLMSLFNTNDLCVIDFHITSTDEHSRLYIATISDENNVVVMSSSAIPSISERLFLLSTSDLFAGNFQTSDGQVLDELDTFPGSALIVSYNVNDANGDPSFSIGPDGPNLPPVANNDFCSITCDDLILCSCCVNVLTNDTDPDGDVLTFRSLVPPGASGFSAANDGQVCYERSPGGVLSISIDYIVADPGGLESSATVFFNFAVRASVTNTPSSSVTGTASATGTSSASLSQSQTPSITMTVTPIPSVSNTPSISISPTLSPSNSVTPGSSMSTTPTISESNTATTSDSFSPTVSPTKSNSPTRTALPTSSITPTNSHSLSTTPTNSLSLSTTQTITPSSSETPTKSQTPTSSTSLSSTVSISGSRFATRSATTSQTKSISKSLSNTISASGTLSSSATVSISLSKTMSPSLSLSATKSSSLSVTSSQSLSHSSTLSRSLSSSRSSSVTASSSKSDSTSPSRSRSPPASITSSISISTSITLTPIPSLQLTKSSTVTISRSPSHSHSLSNTSSRSHSFSSIPSLTRTTTTSKTTLMEFIAPPLDLSHSPGALTPRSQQISAQSLLSSTPTQTSTLISQACLSSSGVCNGGFQVDSTSPSGAEIIVEQPDLNMITRSDTNRVVSVVVNLRLADESATLGGDVEICMESFENKNELCLGFLDESETPPEWVCEDSCLEENSDGLFCGSTNHFTNFALLLGGSSKGGDCGSSGDNWVTGSSFGDMILVLSCVLVCVVFGIVFFLAATYVKPLRTTFYGREGARIINARRAQTHAQVAF